MAAETGTEAACSEREGRRLLTADVVVTHDAGTLYAFYPISEVGRDWLDEHLDPDCPRFSNRYLGNAYVVEHRYATDIIRGAVHDGVTVQDGHTGRYANDRLRQ